MPEVVTGIAELRERLRQPRRQGDSIGLVPTMGALHAGHAALLHKARLENRLVVASIFVNPLQFDRKEDLETYPRTMDQDLLVAGACGVDLIFSPAAAELYPGEQAAFVDLPRLSAHLCGQFRPGHFQGVATVVLKLLNIVQPDRAYFGEKDAQQLAIIRRMVRDLDVPVSIVPVATVREPDGLALSSRNKLLTPAQRRIAPVLSRALSEAVRRMEAGEGSVAAIRHDVLSLFAAYPELRVEYFEIVDPETLAPVEHVNGRVLIAGAIWLGSTRLIDNIAFSTVAPR
jgi:pantoate--beta-alanine ligase